MAASEQPMSTKLHQELTLADGETTIRVELFVRDDGSKEVHISSNLMYPSQLPYLEGDELTDLATLIRRCAEPIRRDASPAPIIAPTKELFLCHDAAACAVWFAVREMAEAVLFHAPENEIYMTRAAALAFADWLEGK